MDRLEERLSDAERSTAALREALAMPKRTALERDAILLRFALAEALERWVKALRRHA